MKKEFIFLCIILIIGFFLRFYKLGQIPNGFYQDESAIGYNAYSLLKTGKDEYGTSWPIYFKSFGDYKLPVYIYTTIPAISLFGMTEFAVRFPSAFFGFLTLIVLYFLIKSLTQKTSYALIGIFFLAINPWHIHYSRATFEVSISLFCFCLGTLLLHKYFSLYKKGYFLAGTCMFVIGLYSYNLTRLLAPLLYILCFLIFNEKKNKKTKEMYITLLINSFFLIPFASSFISSAGAKSAAGTLIFTSAAVKAPIIEFRAYMQVVPSIFRWLYATWFLLLYQYLKNIVNYFNIDFFFLNGSAHGNHGIGTIGQFYLFELPIIIIGIISLWQSKQKIKLFTFGWIGISIATAALTRESPHATRSFFLLLPYTIVIVYGAQASIAWIKTKRTNIQIGISALIIVCILWNIGYYLNSYWIRFPLVYAKSWRSADKPLALYIDKNQTQYKKIVIDPNSGFIYTSLLFYTKYDPMNLQQTVIRTPDDSEGFTNVTSFGKYDFHTVDWKKDYIPGNLLILNPTDIPPGISTIAIFTYPEIPKFYNVKQDIIIQNSRESAYVAVTK